MSALPSYKRQIYSLLGILSAAVVSALLLAGFLVYYYGPKGNYLIRHAILEPQLVTQLNYNDTNNKTGGMSRFVYDGIIFDFYDDKELSQHTDIPLEKYNQLYQMIAADKSILQIPEAITTIFNNPFLNTLSIRTRTESHAAWQNETKRFQEIQFAPQSNYYRVRLREDPSTQQQWAYFNHPNIYQKTLQLFSQ